MGSVPAIIAVHRLVLSQPATTVVITVALSIANPVTTEFALPEPVPELVFEANSAIVPPKEIIAHPNNSSGVRPRDPSHSENKLPSPVKPVGSSSSSSSITMEAQITIAG